VLTQPLADRRHRCVFVAAAAGYGKTTAVRDALAGADAAWLSGADARDLDDAARDLDDAARAHAWVVVDDLPRLTAERYHALVTAVLDQPARVVLASRWPVGRAVSRWRGRGLVTEVAPADLRLPPDRVAALLCAPYGIHDAAVARQVHDLTGGWPALVHFAGEALAAGAAPAAVADPGTPLATYVADEVLGPLPPDAARLVRAAADLAPLSAPLCRTLGYPRADAAVDLLARTGILAAGRIVPAVARVAARPNRAGGRRDRIAADWYARHGPPLAAARLRLRTGDPEACARVLRHEGDAMIGSGEAAAVVELIRALPVAERDHRIGLLLVDALRTTGDTQAALATLDSLADPTAADVAWRLALVHYARHDPRAALAACAAAAIDPQPEAVREAADGGHIGAGHGDDREPAGIGPRGTAPGAGAVDRAQLFAAAATAHWLLGEGAHGLVAARRARRDAAAAGDARALATAEVALALCVSLAGDPAAADGHYARAAAYADRAHDRVLAARIDLNRSHHLLAAARFADAARTAARAVRAAEDAGPPDVLVAALCNEGEALLRLGRHEDALARYERAAGVARAAGSARLPLALAGAGEVHRRRGAREQACGAYEEAVRLARHGGDRRAAVLAAAGLTRLWARDDPAAATVLAKEASGAAIGSVVVAALLATGHAALGCGERAAAADAAGEAVERARRRGEPAWLAEALELRAESDDDPRRRRAALAEAYAIWRDAGASHDADRVLARFGALPGAGPDDRAAALLAARRLAAAGVAIQAADTADGPTVAIRAFGRFEVLVDDRPVAASAWRSRKARDLLRVLVARRGRALPRMALAELLWPDDDSARTAHRLSVQLSIIRTVTGRDVLVADAASVALDLGQVRVDVEDFLGDVAHAGRLRASGAAAQARELLAAADRSYVGDPFADDPYADWAVPIREEARATYLRALRLLAALARDGGDTDLAAAYLRRLLEADPYDEAAHRALVAALVDGGRHGEARRSFARYAEAMAGIGVDPPDDGILSRSRPLAMTGP
jgi:DNA-binding SARP family transcriptional activator